ncbi:MAG: HAMP domain-containing sensor histidine kinase [Planctomycetota bacterium]|nr:MAG: HAMP domain-containing sensor histidine kinase [Planctomycetota bacterium]
MKTVPWPRSLAVKLGAVFLVLLLALGAISLWLMARTANLYFLELQQSLNRTVAAHIAEAARYFKGEQVDEEGLRGLFMKVMAVNPTLEVYVVDPAGRILAYDAPPDKIVRSSLSLEPVRRFLEEPPGTLILGDDPRDRERRKVFSAAPVQVNGQLKGYVYAILASEEYDSAASLLQRSYILRGSAWVAVICVLLAALLGLLALGVLTRPLRRLQRAVNEFRQGNLAARVRPTARDEIGALALDFDAMAERIVQQVDRIRQTDHQRREMVANISHDLRTPLTSLQGYLETCLIKAEELPPEERRRYLEGALRSTKRLGRLVEDLFQLARLDAGDIQPQVERFRLSELAQDVLQKFQFQAQRKGITLTARIPQGLPDVTADIGLIERVLDNLVDNAIRYTPAGGKVVVALRECSGAVEVRVADTGPGIPEKDLPHVFERFYRVEKSRSLDAGGAGLGLAITKRILELHHSSIAVRSRPQVGTVFYFQLAA